MPRPASTTGRRPTRVTVQHVEAEPMTARQYEQALAALAALITAWHAGPDKHTARPSADSAITLPLPAAASDTDHATTASPPARA